MESANTVLAVTLNTAAAETSLLVNSVTVLALLVGGLWAYFKFAKGRNLSLKAQIDASGSWRLLEGRHLVMFEIQLENVGSSKFNVTADGTFVRISSMVGPKADSTAGIVSWKWTGIKHNLFVDEDPDATAPRWWLEPGETAVDEFLVDLRAPDPYPIRYEIHVKYRHWWTHEFLSGSGIVLPGEKANNEETVSTQAPRPT